MQSLKSWSTEKLLSRLQELVSLQAEAVEEASKILVELKNRSIRIVEFTRGPLKHYMEIASGKLHPQALLLCLGNQELLKYLPTYPIDEQLDVARGETLIKTVGHDAEGKIIPVETPALHMSKTDLAIAFSSDGLRPVTQQKRLLAKHPERKHRSVTPLNIRYDSHTEEIICGQMRIPVPEIASALKGYFEVKRVARKSRAQPEDRASL